MNDLAVLVPIVVAVITPIVTYIVAARRMSGKVATSDAAELWRESSAIRNDYRARLLAAGERTAQLEGRLAVVEARNTELARENMTLQAKVMACEAMGESLRATINKLETTIKESRS